MTRHFVARWGNWMLMNWHVYRWREVTSANGKIKRMEWVRIV